MASRNTAFTLAAIKFGTFAVVSVLVTGMLTVIMGNFSFESKREYKALFENASLLKKGDDVRVAGISVGEVQDVQIYHRVNAIVTFKVESTVPMTTKSTATIRYLNLVGDRYLALEEGSPGAPRLPDEATMPLSRTEPALDLTALFNGFQPLFQALQPHDVNQFSMNLIKVLQGEGGTIQSLLAQAGTLTNSIANRDQLVGQVITNLTSMLRLVDNHHRQLNTLVVQLRQWMGKLATDRKAIGDSVQNISSFADQLARLLVQGRPYLKSDIAQLRRVMTVLNKPSNKAVMTETLKTLPLSLQRQTRTGTYGSWYNYYLCNFTGQIILPKQLPNLPGIAQLRKQLSHMNFYSTAARCRS